MGRTAKIGEYTEQRVAECQRAFPSFSPFPAFSAIPAFSAFLPSAFLSKCPNC